jgi:hypothetical protein
MKFKTIKEWQNNEGSAVNAARKHSWLEECTAHMIKQKPLSYWNIRENCAVDAMKYKTKTEWHNKNHNAYRTAKKNGWFEECTAHMIRK